MTIKYIKSGKPVADQASDNEKVVATVAETLKMIEQDGDKAVRKLAEKFDNYSPPSFKLSQQEIDDLIAKVSPEDMADIRFANEQVTNLHKYNANQ